jgi:hypothetical protein
LIGNFFVACITRVCFTREKAGRELKKKFAKLLLVYKQAGGSTFPFLSERHPVKSFPAQIPFQQFTSLLKSSDDEILDFLFFVLKLCD